MPLPDNPNIIQELHNNQQHSGAGIFVKLWNVVLHWIKERRSGNIINMLTSFKPKARKHMRVIASWLLLGVLTNIHTKFSDTIQIDPPKQNMIPIDSVQEQFSQAKTTLAPHNDYVRRAKINKATFTRNANVFTSKMGKQA
eukprot:590953_1